MKRVFIFILTFFLIILNTGCDNFSKDEKGKNQINYYIEQEKGFTLYKQEDKIAPLGALTIMPPSIKGYEFDTDNEKNVLTGEITLDAKTVFCIYYILEHLTVTYMLNEQETYYEATTSAFLALSETKPNDPQKEGLVFKYWKNEMGQQVNFATATSKDIILYAHWGESEEIENYGDYAADYYAYIDEQEYILSLTSDKKAVLKKEGTVLREGNLRITSDGYAYFDFGFIDSDLQASKGYFKSLRLYLMQEQNIVFSKFAHLINDFETETSIEKVENKIYKNWFNNGSVQTATISLVEEASQLPVTYNTTNYNGVLKVELQKKEANEDYYGGGCTVKFDELSKTKNGSKSLKLKVRILVEDRLSAENEVIIFYTLDKWGHSQRTEFYQWYTVGNRAGEWITLEITADKMFGGTEEMIAGLCIKSYRDDNFYVDYISYCYE